MTRLIQYCIAFFSLVMIVTGGSRCPRFSYIGSESPISVARTGSVKVECPSDREQLNALRLEVERANVI